MFRKTQKKTAEVEVAKSSISVATVFIFVGILFAVICYGLFFFRYSDFSPFYKYYANSSTENDVGQNIDSQIQNSASDSLEIKITENQLGKLICVDCDSFPLKKATLQIKPDGIIIAGKTSTAFWGVNVEATIKPKIENEAVVFELTDLKAAGVSAPPKITDSIGSKLRDIFSGDVLSVGQSAKFREVYTMVGYILLMGTK